MPKRDRNRNFLGPSGTSLGVGEFWALTLAGFTLFFAVWAGVAASGWLPPNLLPSPAAVWDTLVRLWRQPFAGHVYAEHLAASVWRFLMGWAIAVAVGIPLGLGSCPCRRQRRRRGAGRARHRRARRPRAAAKLNGTSGAETPEGMQPWPSNT